MNKLGIVRAAAEKAMAGEGDRTRQLLARAEKLIAGNMLVTSFQVASIPTLLESSSPAAKALCYLALAVLILSLFFGFCALRLKGYSSYPRGDKLWESLKSDGVDDEAAEHAVIQLLLKNREQDAKLNDAKTRMLWRCSWLLFGGFALVIGAHLLDALDNVAP